MMLTPAMRRALRLTRKGRLMDATATIRKALGGVPAKPAKPTGPAKPARLAKRATAAKRRAAAPSGPARASGPARQKRDASDPVPAKPRTTRSATARPNFTRAWSPRILPSLAPSARPHAMPRPAVRARAKRGGAVLPAIPEGASYAWHTHENAHGTLRYRLYVPASAARASRPMPLVVMLHGCTQGADDFALGTRILKAAERRRMVVALPEQERSANAMGCWRWFERAHQGARSGEPALIAGMIDEVMTGRGVSPAGTLDPDRIFVAGLSAGGAMAATMGAVRPDLFAGVGVHSGLPHGAAHDMASAMSAMRSGAGSVPPIGPRGEGPRLFIAHGTADGTVSPRNADRLLVAMGRGETTSERDGRTSVTRLARGGRVVAEDHRIAGLGHAWSGGEAGGSYTAPDAPDATRAMLRFFLDG